MKYRRITYDIEAIQFTGDNFEAVAKWAGVFAKNCVGDPRLGRVLVNTPDGTMVANGGDWLLMGADGEVSVCETDFFEACYEPIIEPSRVLLPGLGARMN